MIALFKSLLPNTQHFESLPQIVHLESQTTHTEPSTSNLSIDSHGRLQQSTRLGLRCLLEAHEIARPRFCLHLHPNFVLPNRRHFGDDIDIEVEILAPTASCRYEQSQTPDSGITSRRSTHSGQHPDSGPLRNLPRRCNHEADYPANVRTRLLQPLHSYISVLQQYMPVLCPRSLATTDCLSERKATNSVTQMQPDIAPGLLLVRILLESDCRLLVRFCKSESRGRRS